ncbi:Leucine-rich repeat-containing protein 27 [Taenia crassiceps]|uniref:Leucine-rich repeat-containing protein 27 n=1 Tax=Taenia crassiceps TaxID=6207 RepID=A0ABR4QRG2_9CEST
MASVQGLSVCDSYQNQTVSEIFDAKFKKLDSITLENCELVSIPNEVLSFTQLRICSLPDEFFCSFPQLNWLDLRFNLLSAIPRAIKNLTRIKNLLIGHNNIQRLCVELGGMENLIGLNTEGNPLQFPSEAIIIRGSKYVLKYLRDCYAKRTHLESKIKAQTASLIDPQTHIDELAIGSVNEEILARESCQNFAPPSQALPSLFKSRMHRRIENKLWRFPRIGSGIFTRSCQSQRHALAYQSGSKLVSEDSVRKREINERARCKRRWDKLRQDSALQRWKDREMVDEWKTSYQNKQRLLLSMYRKKQLGEIKEESRNRIRMAPFGVNSEATFVISSVELEKLKTAARPAILPDPPPRPRSRRVILQLEKDRRREDNILIDEINEQANFLDAKMANPCLPKSLADAQMDLVRALQLQLRLRNRHDILTQLKTATNPTAFMQEDSLEAIVIHLDYDGNASRPATCYLHSARH